MIDLQGDKRILAIRKMISRPAQYEQMAEECCELAQALLKKARRLRNENFTPKTLEECDDDIREELTDVVLCAQVLDIYADPNVMNEKLNRWVMRNTPDEG